MPTELIAVVALRATLGTPRRAVLSYRVPPRLRGLVRPGQLVWAPLRRGRVQGVVLSLTDDNPPGALRELDDLGDPEATLTTAGLALAEWIAATYRAPLYEALALLLPPGVSQEAETTWRASPTGMAVELGALPERERAVLYYLRTRGEQSERALRRALRGTDTELRAVYAALAERGLATRGVSQTSPAARPRMVRYAHLAVPANELAQALAELTRAPRQAAALRWLAEQAGPTPLAELTAATGAAGTVLRELERRGLVALERRELRRDPLVGTVMPPDQPPLLTMGQRAAYEAIVAALEALRPPANQTNGQTGAHESDCAEAGLAAPTGRPPAAPVFLLHGVTGSGKTEVYLRVIARALRLGHQALVLVPEIALTAQLVRRFAARFPGQLAVLHSGLALGERYDEWRRLRRGVARLAIGSRSAVFAPLPTLGLIVVDEEHELSYKHDGRPRYQARDVALQLAKLTGSVVILGSATPAVESYQQAIDGAYQLLELPDRVGGSAGADGLTRSVPLPLPAVRLVDMRNELQDGNRSIFSRALQLALAETLRRSAQSILFLNRRGAAAFVLCRDCGHVVSCGACSGPMTVHYDDGDERPVPPQGERTEAGQNGQPAPATLLICHSCGAHGPMPYICPQCLSPRVRSFGVGTQRVAEEVAALLPAARVLRWDRDTSGGKGAHGRMLDAMLRSEVDVLVGTQMIAKGLDLPLVGLVGVVAADTGLHLPDFRSGERAFQLLTQVAGRAGRRTADAQVIIQSYNPEHYALRAAQEHDYRAFFSQEIAYRRATGYPPFSRLVRFIYADADAATARYAAERLAERTQALIARRCLAGWGLVGPAPAFIQRARGRWRWHLILRVPGPSTDDALVAFLTELAPPRGWIIDVDPAHVL